MIAAILTATTSRQWSGIVARRKVWEKFCFYYRRETSRRIRARILLTFVSIMVNCTYTYIHNRHAFTGGQFTRSKTKVISSVFTHLASCSTLAISSISLRTYLPSLPGKMSRVLGLQSRLADVVGKPLRTKVDRTQMRGDPEVCMHIYIYMSLHVCVYM